MKKRVVLFMFLMASAVAVSAQTIQVEGDQRLEADISKFKTFAFASQVDNKLDPGMYFLNDLMLKQTVREAVQSELQGLGYTKGQGSADLLVNFRLFDKPVTLRGFEGMGSTYWGTDEVRDPDAVTQYDVKAGTLMVHLVDAKKGQVIWQGFASGLIENDQFVKDPSKVREAVNMIFEEFGQRANEYTRL